MEASQVRAIVGREIAGLKRRLGLQHWTITIRYEGIAGSDEDGWRTQGLCHRLPQYEQASITLDPGTFDDADEIVRILRHELFHIVLAPFDLYRSHQTRSIRAGSLAERQEHEVWDHACEQAVRSLERLWDGLAAAPPRPRPKPKPKPGAKAKARAR